MEMTPKELTRICRSLDLYQTPELNDKLYLHYKGFSRIQHLEPYTDLRVLYLEGNALSDLTGLSHQLSLRCLYAQENRIESLDSLPSLPALSTLNLNHNLISSLPSTLSTTLPSLHTLNLKANRLSSLSSLAPLHGHPTLSILDLSANRFDEADPSPEAFFTGLLGLLATIPSLRVLYLAPAGYIGGVGGYRKRVVGAVAGLTYLDDRPVFEEERRMVQAWMRGGLEGEREEKQRMREEDRDRQERQWRFFDELVGAGKKGREEEEKEQMSTAEVEEVLGEGRRTEARAVSDVLTAWGAEERKGGEGMVGVGVRSAGKAKGQVLIEVVGEEDNIDIDA